MSIFTNHRTIIRTKLSMRGLVAESARTAVISGSTCALSLGDVTEAIVHTDDTITSRSTLLRVHLGVTHTTVMTRIRLWTSAGLDSGIAVAGLAFVHAMLQASIGMVHGVAVPAVTVEVPGLTGTGRQ